jgi:protein-tyrosine phosphatase
MLIELDFNQRPCLFEETIYKLQLQGIIPILAHVERYGYIMENLQVLYDWTVAGGYAQVNAESIISGGKTEKRIAKLAEWNLVHLIASDAHSLHHRPPNLRQGIDAFRSRHGDEKANTLVNNAKAVFHGEYIDTTDAYCPKKILGKWR